MFVHSSQGLAFVSDQTPILDSLGRQAYAYRYVQPRHSPIFWVDAAGARRL